MVFIRFLFLLAVNVGLRSCKLLITMPLCAWTLCGATSVYRVFLTFLMQVCKDLIYMFSGKKGIAMVCQPSCISFFLYILTLRSSTLAFLSGHYDQLGCIFAVLFILLMI